MEVECHTVLRDRFILWLKISVLVSTAESGSHCVYFLTFLGDFTVRILRFLIGVVEDSIRLGDMTLCLVIGS
jgi:hypothetical protein